MTSWNDTHLSLGNVLTQQPSSTWMSSTHISQKKLFRVFFFAPRFRWSLDIIVIVCPFRWYSMDFFHCCEQMKREAIKADGWQNADEIVKFYALSVLFHALKLFHPSVKTQKFVSSWSIFQAIITLRHDAINFSNPPTSCQTLKFSLTTALKIHSKFVTKFINFKFFMFSLLSLMLGKWIYGVEEMSTVFSMFFLNMTHLTSTSHQQHEK